MNETRDNLIADLVADLKPVERPGKTGGTAVLWIALAIAYTGGITLATGPIRPTAFTNLIAYPTFALETLVAVLCIVTLTFATLRSAIPGAGRPAKMLVLPIVASLAWLSFYVIGLWEPAHPVSMLGKRDHCVLQAWLFSLPSLAVLLLFARRLWPVWPSTTGALAGAAAAAIPAAMMQFACMYAPGHIITHHLGPAVLVAFAGALIGRFVLVQRQPVARKRSESVH